MRNRGIRSIGAIALAAVFMLTAVPAAAAPTGDAETNPVFVEEGADNSGDHTMEAGVPAAVSKAANDGAPFSESGNSEENHVTAVPENRQAEENTASGTGLTEEGGPQVAEETGKQPEADGEAADTTEAGEKVMDSTGVSKVILTDGTAEEAAEAEESEAEEELEKAEKTLPTVSYRTHVQTYGWEQDYVQDGDMSGTSGQAKRLEGIQIRVSGAEDLGIEYRTHVQTIGWQDYVADGAVAGTTGQSRRLEAIQIRLTGSAAADYDVYYCVHVQTYGWLNWAKNDQMAGTAGYSKRLEGICIRILPKGSAAPEPLAGAVSCFLDNTGGSAIGANAYQVIYNTHVQTYGWQDWVGDGATGGTSGMSKRLEGIHILLQNQEVSGSIEYRTHVQGIGWQDWVRDGALAGTTGQSRRLEALQIRLTGEMANTYDVWYRTHCQHFGWRGWAKNGEEAGTQGYAYRMEAIEIMLLPKGSAAPGSTAGAFSVATIRELYPLASARLDQIGWDLRAAFNWSASMPYYRLSEGVEYGARYFATYGFQNGRGDCYVMAACFYEMAKALGYNAHWMFGYVPLRAGGMGIHSWVEIDMNGATYVCDPDYTHDSGGNGYMFTYGTPGTWRYTGNTRMN